MLKIWKVDVYTYVNITPNYPELYLVLGQEYLFISRLRLDIGF